MFVILKLHSLHYQLLSTDECNKLPETQNLGTTAQFPVSYNAPVKVQCDTGYSLIGDHIITCIRGDSFRSFHDQLPSCKASECAYFRNKDESTNDFVVCTLFYSTTQLRCTEGYPKKIPDLAT